jgi:hypothetical protein
MVLSLMRQSICWSRVSYSLWFFSCYSKLIAEASSSSISNFLSIFTSSCSYSSPSPGNCHSSLHSILNIHITVQYHHIRSADTTVESWYMNLDNRKKKSKVIPVLKQHTMKAVLRYRDKAQCISHLGAT